jgi:hypothetical protein
MVSATLPVVIDKVVHSCVGTSTRSAIIGPHLMPKENFPPRLAYGISQPGYSIDANLITEHAGDVIPNPTVVIDEVDVFLLTEINGKSLQTAFENEEVIIFSAAASESVIISLVCKLNDYEWLFKAETSKCADFLHQVGTFRVLGKVVITSRRMPHI